MHTATSGTYTEYRDMTKYKKSQTGFSAQNYKIAGATASLFGNYLQGKTDKTAAAFDRFTSEQRARLLVRNAEARFAAGTREAGDIALQGRKVESDAIAAMIAQGGTVDPTIIAKLNQYSTYNALSAIFSATRDKNAMIMEAETTRATARINEAVAKANAANSLFDSAVNWGTTIMMGKST